MTTRECDLYSKPKRPSTGGACKQYKEQRTNLPARGPYSSFFVAVRILYAACAKYDRGGGGEGGYI